MLSPVVVIPVHKRIPNQFERASLSHCGKILGGRTLTLLCPRSLDVSPYLELIKSANILRVDDTNMESIGAYNKMMVSNLVIDALAGHTHMLVHEPDAIVLSDQLDEWCDTRFDYIGAPWFSGFDIARYDAPIIGAGNFGFSLMRLEAARRVIKSDRRWYPLRSVLQDVRVGLSGDSKRLRFAWDVLGQAGRFSGASKVYTDNCDIFWGMLVQRIDKAFVVAPPEIAVRFSWEVNPKRCMEICKGNLPFGIHAWAKYDFDFLRPILEKSDVKIP